MKRGKSQKSDSQTVRQSDSPTVRQSDSQTIRQSDNPTFRDSDSSAQIFCPVGKKAQLKISFGMIFAIILVIVFIAFAFYAIQKFMSLQENLIMKKFQENFENDLDKVWSSSQASKRVTYTVSSNTEQICIMKDNRGLNNIRIYYDEGFASLNLEKIDPDKSLVNGKPMCVNAEDSKISFLLTKKYGENLVTVKA